MAEITDKQKEQLLNAACENAAVLSALKDMLKIRFDEDTEAQKEKEQTAELFDTMFNVARQKRKKHCYRFGVNSETKDKLERYCFTGVFGGYTIGFDGRFAIGKITVVADDGLDNNCFEFYKISKEKNNGKETI